MSQRALMTPEQRERDREKTREWRRANPDKMKAYKKKYYDAHPEQGKKERDKHYAKNRDRVLAKQRLWYATTNQKEKQKAKYHLLKATDPDKLHARQRAGRDKNPALYRFYTTRSSAQDKGIEFDLDVEWFRTRLEAGVCELSGIPFDKEGKRTPNSASIDRIDPFGPYTKANCRMILWWLNRALLNLGEDYAISVFEAVIAKKKADAKPHLVFEQQAKPRQKAQHQ